MYPVISMEAPHVHAGSRGQLLGASPTAQQLRAYSPHHQVRADTPPAFLVHAYDDASVPVENSLLYADALRAVKVPVETHLFEEGGHGFAIRLAAGKPAEAWPALFLTWAKRRGYLG
jgi:dipeptidyl aminopeptidase/acylaminoacyl peptidase